ncbi:MAG TPA: glycoside hydrolase family 13 protein [Nitrospirales bacterium]|nr:glycoside hydrolase family 13 protein [Nitrospirales bacterium]
MRNHQPASDISWTREAILYQIFPDRFARDSHETKSGPGIVPWRSKPTAHGFMGGTLRGITERLDYLLDLGVNLIYLAPIFFASANHRYNTYDYFRIDPRLGSLADFQGLLSKAHANDIRVLLDGVFNHCGRGFFPFYDVMERGQASPFASWFYITRFPVNAFGPFNYRGWQERPLMPILNLANPATRRYFLEVAAYWTNQGIDGWRLDAVADVRGHRFWKALWHEVKTINPSAYMLAEIWGPGRSWIRDGQFDGGTNYVFRQIVLDYFIQGSISTRKFVSRVSKLLRMYPWKKTSAMVNLLGSHDTERLYTVAQGNIERLKLALLFQFVFPGIPAVYYGDEIGMEGEKDPDNRRGMEWNQSKWNDELRDFTKRLVAIRKSLPTLRQGDWTVIQELPDQQCCVFLRKTKRSVVFILIHNDDHPVSIQIDLAPWVGKTARWLEDHLTGNKFKCEKGKVVLADFGPRSGMILTPVSQAGA